MALNIVLPPPPPLGVFKPTFNYLRAGSKVPFTIYDTSTKRVDIYISNPNGINMIRQAKVEFPISANGKIYGATIISGNHTTCLSNTDFAVYATCNFERIPHSDYKYFTRIYADNLNIQQIGEFLDILLMESILLLPDGWIL